MIHHKTAVAYSSRAVISEVRDKDVVIELYAGVTVVKDNRIIPGHILTGTHLRRECQHVSSGTSCCCAFYASFWHCSRCYCTDFCGSWGRCPSWSDQGQCTGRQSSCGPCSSGSPQTDARHARARTSSPPWNLEKQKNAGWVQSIWCTIKD